MNPVLNELFGGLYRLILDRFEQPSVVHFVFMTGLPCQGFMFLVLVLVVWPHFGIPFFLIVVAPFITIPRRDLLPSLLVATIINCRHILTL